MTQDLKATVVFYTMENYPPEDSPYALLNKALRAKDRESVKIWRHYVWLFLHALREIPASDVHTVNRG